jgi:methylenetetrahydrofolate dehydrogenase (NADP+)/methenyltetrahydrofolate cyclohydrolase
LENGLHEYIYSSDSFWILELLERYGVETQGKHVVIGRSHIVGRPDILMGRKGFPGNSTVTLTHSYTRI